MDDHQTVRMTVDVNRTIRDLMAVGRVAVVDTMPQPDAATATAVLEALLALVREQMPDELRRQDRRVVEAEALLVALRSIW